MLFTISLFGSSLLAPRYFVSTLPALALLVGWGLRTIGPPRARAIAATTVVVVALLSTGGLQHSSASQEVSYEDWRGAARAEQTIVGNTHIPVLVHTAYVESARISWLTRLETRSYLLSPLSIYPMTGRIIAMPYTLDGPAYAYLQGIMDRILVHAKRFLLVTRYPFVPYRTWLDGRLGPLGYRSRLVGTYGTIEIILFQR